MPTPRFYSAELAKKKQLSEFVVTLDRDESRHAVNVLRLKVDDAVELFDGQGRVATGCVKTVDKPGVTVAVTEWHDYPQPNCSITIASAIPKGPRADHMIQQLSQVGVDRLVPLLTERSVVQPGAGKVEKFRRAALESCKQCGRAHVMAIDEPHHLNDMLVQQAEVRLIADASGQAINCEPATANLSSAKSILVLVGPEGGWTDEEKMQATRAGFASIRLGPHILRIETAAVVAAVLCRPLAEPDDPQTVSSA